MVKIEFDISGIGPKIAVIEITEALTHKDVERIKTRLNKEIPGFVRVDINTSSAGDMHNAKQLFYYLKGNEFIVETNVYGYVCNAGVLIAQAANGNMRYISPHSLVMVNGEDYVDSSFVEIGFNSEKIKKLIDMNDGNGKWLSAQEAIDFGFFEKMLPNYHFDIEAEGLNHQDNNSEYTGIVEIGGTNYKCEIVGGKTVDEFYETLSYEEILKLAIVGATAIEAEKQKIPISATGIYNTFIIKENN